MCVCGAVAALVVVPGDGRAQSTIRYDVGVGAAFFVDLPEPFQEQYCEANAAGLGGSIGWRALEWLVLEGSALITGELGGGTCAIPSLAPVPLDTPIIETFYDDSMEGVGFFATHASAVIEPFRSRPVSPRVRGGVGWLWQKNLFDWTWGAGVVYRFGPYALSTDVEQWNMDIDQRQETVIYRSGGGRELQSTETITRTYSPWVVRFGVEFAFPR
jgi:hypothetical protein